MKPLLRRLRLASRIALGTEPRIREDLGPEGREHLGTGYGGWTILPDLLDPSSLVYSFGVCEDISFDLALIERCGVTVHAFDPTPRSLDWVAAQETPTAFHLHPLGVADFDGAARFERPADERHVSLRLTVDRVSGDALELPVARLQSILDRVGHPVPALLKMDVEGAEYAVLDDLVRSGLRPRQLLVEFHHHLPGFEVSDTRGAVERLRGAGYRVFSVSPNNHEVSFLHG